MARRITSTGRGASHMVDMARKLTKMGAALSCVCLLLSCTSYALDQQLDHHDNIDGSREISSPQATNFDSMLHDAIVSRGKKVRGAGLLQKNTNNLRHGTLENVHGNHFDNQRRLAFDEEGAVTQEQEQQEQQQELEEEYNFAHEVSMKLPLIVTAPDRRDYNFTVGLCAMVKDDGVYLEEWLDYQLGVLEFDGIIVFDNSPDFVWKRWYENTRDHPLYQKVEIIHQPSPHNLQPQIYTTCAKEFGYATDVKWIPSDSTDEFDYESWSTNLVSNVPNRRRFNYMAFFDVDEFLVLKQHAALRHVTEPYNLGPVLPTDKVVDRIHDVIQDVWRRPHGGRGNLSLNWMLVGYSQKTLYSPLPVLKRFQYRTDLPDATMKSIVFTRDVEQNLNAHGVQVKELDESDPQHEQVQNWAMDVVHTNKPALFSNPETKASVASSEENVDASILDMYSDVALLYHVRYTSLEEYRQKRCVRLAPGGRVKGCDMTDPEHPKLYMNKEDDQSGFSYPEHMYPHSGNVLDDAPWRLLKWKVPKYNMFDAIFTVPGNEEDDGGSVPSTPVWNDYHFMSSTKE